ncbi:MAG: DUF4172 domain-containing protein [Methanomassiliicoccaceae archaeon]|nr:DUF4172 domain-containing protein [Methanomassiliicoccaceae archaeon]
MYIHERNGWTEFRWDRDRIDPVIRKVRFLQGKLHGMMEGLKTDAEKMFIDTITSDIMSSFTIDSEYIDEDYVRASVRGRLGIENPGKTAGREDGIVGMMMDATQDYQSPLTKERLLQWHSMMLCSGLTGQIIVSEYRCGDIAIVSGTRGKERILYVAPDPEVVEKEMINFLKWVEEDHQTDILIKSAVSHMWFVMIHPFDDCNGHIARAISEMMLARSEDSCMRYYSVASRISQERKRYFELLERLGCGDGDLTEWIKWFLLCTEHALNDSITAAGSMLEGAEFWRAHSDIVMNERQMKTINMLLAGAHSDMSSSKWAIINHCSQDTAINDINYLIEKGVLIKCQNGGRSTRYALVKKCPPVTEPKETEKSS